ncbi:uncharacterized protein K452DRAFT_330096 [Aplosporella prunicola CBS 121167]|uniref:Major facilitator superfamily (MFS) profile domain-containing protein n=1 Tax=Aplosporella prunicola CBS 121167 TaxID=1176127 RepID=A0A6A6AXL4_9PEZI|nr:uncharacterized protein K452DRAFT_330096 [Aplosporella prunicola CBS 121167]KAF2135684.1 hypothetical protein K452DRAFT_330096 [Aplosporella prunicola CBS 121167]
MCAMPEKSIQSTADVSTNIATVTPNTDVESSSHTTGEEESNDVETKAFIIFMTAFGSIFSPLSGQMYLPSLNTMAREYHVSIANINLSVTTYMILQGIAPMFFGDLADQAGRRPVYIMCFTIYVFANLGLALQRDYAALLVLRALQSSGSSGTIALANGVVADITTSTERGSYVAWVQLGTQLGPALGPVIGGILSQFLGWPSIFWFLLIASGIYLILYVGFVPETGRNIVGDGSIPPQGWNKSLTNFLEDRSREQKGTAEQVIAKTSRVKFPNPLNALRIIVEKDVCIILFVLSMYMACFFCLMVPMPSLFAETYDFNTLQVGLCYIPFSVGAIVGSLTCGRLMDRNYRRVAQRAGFPIDRKRSTDLRRFPIERARLGLAWYPLFTGSTAILVWGWVLRARTSLAAPLVVLFVGGAGLSGAMSMITSLLVDLYPTSPATATAALNVCRCLLSAAATAVVEYIIKAWGLGWTYTFLGLVMFACAPPLLLVLKFGPTWREERFLRIEGKERKRQEAKEQGAKDATKE